VGGRPREVAESVFMADWSPDGRSLAAIRLVDGRFQLEAPLGRVVHTAAGWLSYPRWSPDGSSIAFNEHPHLGNNAGHVCIVRLGEPYQRLTPQLEMASRMSWRPDSREIWSASQVYGTGAGVYGITLDGVWRCVYSAPGWPMVTDISKSGGVLLAMGRPRMRLEAGTRSGGVASAVDLSWLDWTLLRDMSPDGSVVVFDETGLGAGSGPGVYLRSTDGAPAMRLADGICSHLSPDGRWVLAGNHREAQLIRMVPTGAGEVRTFDLGDFSVSNADWIPGTEDLLVIGTEPGGARRPWRYDTASGNRTPIGEATDVAANAATSPDGRLAIIRSASGRVQLLDLAGGAVRDFDELEVGIRIAGWTADSKSVFVFSGGGIPSRVFRVDVGSGAAEPWMELWPAHRSGVDSINSVKLSADGERYACSYPMIDSTLYHAQGLS